MFQLCNLINRSTIPSDPSNNMNTSEDFLLLLLHAHVVAAAKMFGSHKSVTDLAKSIVNLIILPRTDEPHEAVSTYTDKVYLYAIELLSVALLQYYYIFSERKKAQLLWSQCVNTRGYQGRNIPCDLFMEHLNRRLKSILRGMGANINFIFSFKNRKSTYTSTALGLSI